MLARVIQLDRGYPLLRLEDGTITRARHATSLVKNAQERAVIGDLVHAHLDDDADMAQIDEVLTRAREFTRKDPTERAVPQVLAANFDVVLVAHSAPQFNEHRFERELVLAHDSGARVVVLLTKCDLLSDDELHALKGHVEGLVSDDVAVVLLSVRTQVGIRDVIDVIPAGEMGILVGASGAGKSSLVNALCSAAAQDTQLVREFDGKGRHTTVNRVLLPIDGGGEIVDMPGVRGLGLWESEAGIMRAFPEIDQAAQACKFRDCTHTSEPGCGVLAALESGEIRPSRLESFHRLMEENERMATQKEESVWAARKGHPRRRRAH